VTAGDRRGYELFAEGRIAGMTVSNRFVRSATQDLTPPREDRFSPEDFELYRTLARSGIGLIMTGGIDVFPAAIGKSVSLADWEYDYDLVRIEGLAELVAAVKDSAPGCRVVAQLQNGPLGGSPSSVASPFSRKPPRALTRHEIARVVTAYAETIAAMRAEGADGVQIHAAHGGLLSRFLSPYSNRRGDVYGGTSEKRSRIIREIVERARDHVDDFPILIKANGTDCVVGGQDLFTFPQTAAALERAGVDAIEISGGMWDCLARSEEELGFRPVPAPESRTQIAAIERQSYFLPYAEAADVGIPIILSGGNRNVERMEEIVSSGGADFVSMCRPLIREPDLVRRWKESRGGPEADCIACNSCVYAMVKSLSQSIRATVFCPARHDPELHREAQVWLATWVQKHRVGGQTPWKGRP